MTGWGILGTGKILDKYAGAFPLLADARVTAVASRDPDRARAAAARFPGARAHAGYDRLLADPSVDVVLNALHNGLHAEWSARALAAGKHVLCEKPIACSSAELHSMFAAARANRRWLMEGFMYRFHPQMPMIRRRIAAGDIGRILAIRAQYTGQARERPNPRYLPQAGGGALMDLGCYCVNFCRFIAGTEPLRVAAQSRRDTDSGVDITTDGELEFGGGVVARFTASFEPPGAWAAEITGESATLTVPHPWRPPAWPARFHLRRPDSAETVTVDPPGCPRDPLAPFALEFAHFNHCVTHNLPPRFPPDTDAEQDSRANMRVIESLAAAAR
jgi:xylose dehydrogenase (NAD/NADP)